jgi:hypothetical protein
MKKPSWQQEEYVIDNHQHLTATKNYLSSRKTMEADI